jgi:hypothetical protein
MTTSLPQEARDAFDRFVTCELTTVGKGQQPITWPLTPYYEQGAPTIDVTTGLGYPKKADDAKRHPSVAMLFSDPTGSGLEGAAQVLVQGIAEVDEADLAANRERYLRESNVKLPATKDMHPPALVRRMLSWYYDRIYIKVRPERVFIWPQGDVTREPEIQDSHLEEVRSGHVETPPESHGSPAPGEPAWDERVDRLAGRDETAVVSWLAPDGFPLAARVPIELDKDSRSIRLHAEPEGAPLLEGRACLTVHEHAPDFTWQRNFQIRGNLARGEGGWSLTPRKLVGGFELPDSFVGRNKQFLSRMVPYYRTARQRSKQARS